MPIISRSLISRNCFRPLMGTVSQALKNKTTVTTATKNIRFLFICFFVDAMFRVVTVSVVQTLAVVCWRGAFCWLDAQRRVVTVILQKGRLLKNHSSLVTRHSPLVIRHSSFALRPSSLAPQSCISAVSPLSNNAVHIGSNSSHVPFFTAHLPL
jgi:hypothetical protein